MATDEYNDLFLKCQVTAPYHVFVFDIEDSKKMDNDARLKAQYQIIDLAVTIYQKIQEKEKQENKKILVFDEDFNHLWDKGPRKNWLGMKTEPFLLGDMIGFTIYRDSLSREEVLYLFEKAKIDLNIEFNMHQADGYYETNKYEERKNKYFRGYCIDLLSNMHKEKNSDVREALSKKR